MKRILLFVVAAVLLLTGTSSGGLSVHEYVTGEKVTFDDATGLFWYWNLEDFVNKTYDEQITAIADLGTYGDIAGGWHMATSEEMLELWDYTGAEIGAAFNPSGLDPHYIYYYGRYDLVSNPDPPSHFIGPVHYQDWNSLWPKATLTYMQRTDAYFDRRMGAWVTTDAAVVPAPGSFILAAFGLLTVGAKLRRRKR